MSLFSFLTRTRAGKKPPPRKSAPMGHRGIAAGDLRPGRQDISQANIDRWKTLTSDAVADFLEGEPLFVHSTWVAMAQWHAADETLMVEFKDGGAVLVHDVTERLAIEFAQAQSKGAFMWDRVLVRGEGNKGKTQMRVTKLR